MTTKVSSQVSVNSFPVGTIPLANQVAGHTFQDGTDAVGMLKDQHGDVVLKPLGKPICGEREKRFYELLQTTTHPCLLSLKRLVPEYRGSTTVDINGRQLDFIKLSDLTHNMHEPCIMDIKVGKRTWDPLATQEKIIAEEEKYAACKKSIGLCIPGFQVYNNETGKLCRFGKDYGKQLNETTFKDTLRMFLNATKSGFCRKLIAQILTELRSIQKWVRTQTYYKLYSSSILIVYDAKRMELIRNDNKLNCNNVSNGAITSSQQSPRLAPSDENRETLENVWSSERRIPKYRPQVETHEKENDDDYEQTVKQLNSDNCANKLIDSINGYDENDSWSYVKMIDFAHAFPTDDDSIDTNYLFGIDNLVRIFSEFLKECG